MKKLTFFVLAGVILYCIILSIIIGNEEYNKGYSKGYEDAIKSDFKYEVRIYYKLVEGVEIPVDTVFIRIE